MVNQIFRKSQIRYEDNRSTYLLRLTSLGVGKPVALVMADDSISKSIFQLVGQTEGVPVCWGNIPHLCPAPYLPNGPVGVWTVHKRWLEYKKRSMENWRRERLGNLNLDKIFVIVVWLP